MSQKLSLWDTFRTDEGTRPTKDGTIVELGPDHYARLTAVKRFIELLTAGRPVTEGSGGEEEKRTITLAEFEELYREHSASKAE